MMPAKHTAPYRGGVVVGTSEGSMVGEPAISCRVSRATEPAATATLVIAGKSANANLRYAVHRIPWGALPDLIARQAIADAFAVPFFPAAVAWLKANGGEPCAPKSSATWLQTLRGLMRRAGVPLDTSAFTVAVLVAGYGVSVSGCVPKVGVRRRTIRRIEAERDAWTRTHGAYALWSAQPPTAPKPPRPAGLQAAMRGFVAADAALDLPISIARLQEPGESWVALVARWATAQR